MRWRWRKSRRHGASCSVTPIPTSPPTNAERRNSSAAASSSKVFPATAPRSRAKTLQAALGGYGGHSPHQMVASALSITQASEAGTIYRTDEDRNALRDRPCPLAGRAHGRRALCQCAGSTQRHAGADDMAVRHRRAVVRRHQGRRHGGGGGDHLRQRTRRVFWRAAQARRPASCPSTASWPRSLPPIWPTTFGSSLRATPTPWPIGWRKSSAKQGCRRCGRSRPISCSSRCRAPSTPSSRPPAPVITCARAATCALPAEHVLARLVTSFATQAEDIERFVNLCKSR